MAKPVNFSVVFKKSTESLKKDFVPMIVLASVFGVAIGLLDYGKNSILFPGDMMTYGSPEITASVWVSVVVAIVVNLFALLRTVAFMKMGTDMALQRTPSATEAIEYSIKNFLSFLWTSIVGTIYGLGWAVIGVILIPLYVFSVMLLPKFMETNNFLNLKVVSFTMGLIGVVTIVYAIYRGLKITFMANAFLQDDKRGIDAAKSSMTMVEGRWWDVFLVLLGIGIVMWLINFGVMLVTGLALMPLLALAPKVIGTVVTTIISSALTLFGTVLVCNLYNEYKHMGSAGQTHE
ncbi:hypothetical protein KAZ92_02130 [Candidatus Gracilibacteria bacterium]|nr:hypothetical protein [Candidatus Gracilibacteria bacterium]